jgi:two-component system, chemotaxis family, chemotaxis protein CheY
MPEILLCIRNPASLLQLEQICARCGLRSKSVTEPAQAIEWLSHHGFNALMLDPTLSPADQERLATLLWESEAEAPVIIYAPTETRQVVATGARFSGAEFLSGPDAPQALEKLLRDLAEETKQGGLQGEILVVEDLDAPREIICAFIESLGFNVGKGSPSAREALQKLQNTPGSFACVVTDVRMPEISGAELIREIRRDERLKHLPIIALTAYGTADCLIECLQAGASGFLVKPPKRKDLVRELSRARRILRRQLPPRLVQESEMEIVREYLAEKGLL